MNEKFHISESEFNRLSNYDRLLYLFDRFYIGQEVCIRVNNESPQSAIIWNPCPTGDSINRIANGLVQSYSSLSIIDSILVNKKPPVVI